MFQLSRKAIIALDNLKSKARIINGTRPVYDNDMGIGPKIKTRTNTKTGEEETIWEHHITCHIMDSYSGTVYASADGDTQEEALENAIAVASGSERPKTPAEMMAENRKLRAKVASLESGTDSSDIPDEDESEETEDDNSDPTENDLTSSDIAKALKSQGKPVPFGNRNTNAWKEKAMAALNG